jgi:hypothetical protein
VSEHLWDDEELYSLEAHAPDPEDLPAAPITAAPAPAAVDSTGATPTRAGNGYARRFPLACLPSEMRAYALDVAERKQVPVDLTALTMLGIISGLTGPRILVRRDHDWLEPTNLFALVGMDSGSAKSPAVNELRRGLWKATQLIRSMHERKMRERQAELDTEIEECLGRVKDKTLPLEEQAGLKKRAVELQEKAETLARKPPKPPVLSLDGDTTPEALTARMAANGGGASIIDDEGTLLRNLGGQYSGKTANLAVLLKGYDCLPYHPERATRETEGLTRAALSVTISPQPRLVADMMRNTMMSDTGLINRFLVSLPGDLVGKRQGRPSTFIDDTATRTDRDLALWWADLLETLAQYEILTGEHGEDAPIVDLTREAWKLHYEYQEQLEPRMDPATGDLAKVRGWVSKHAGRVLRLALLLHVAAGFTTDDRISGNTMRAAIGLGDWSLEHLLHMGKVVGLSENAGRIKAYIDGREFRCASRSEINAEVFRRNATADQLAEWANELVDTGRYEWAKFGTGGRPKEVLRVVAPRPVAAAGT